MIELKYPVCKSWQSFTPPVPSFPGDVMNFFGAREFTGLDRTLCFFLVPSRKNQLQDLGRQE